MKALELYFAGAEVPTWRKLLVAEQVPHVAVNYLHLKPRITRRPWLLADHFPAEQSIFLDSGAVGVNRKRWTPAQHEEFLAEYLEFVQDNLDRISYFTECDFVNLGLEWILRQRLETWGDLAPEKFVPIWREEWGAPLLRTMIDSHPNLGVPTLSPSAQNSLGPLVRGSKLTLHGLSFAHPHDAPGGLYSTIISSSWISPMRFGETVVWDTNRLRRYSAEDKDKARRRHRGAFTRAGFDAERIIADDNKEVARYTIWAWRQQEAHLAGPQRMRLIPRPIVTNGATPHPAETAPVDVPAVAIEVVATPGNGSHAPDVSRPLPVFDYRPVTSQVTSSEGKTVDVQTSVTVMSQAPLRQCSSCSLAMVCPEFTPGSNCRFSIPVEIRTRDQLMGILHSLLEMQGQRVAFGFFAEQLQGGYPDANLSSELDRFMRMTQSVKDIQDNRDFLKVTVEGRGEVGVLRRLFGAERAESLHRVDADRAETAVRRTMQP